MLVSLRKPGITLGVVASLATAACATSNLPAVPTQAELPALEREVAGDSTRVDALVRLGAGYRAAGRLDEARSTLELAVRQDPDNAAATLFLGLTYEDLESYDLASRTYGAFLTSAPDSDLTDELESRRALLERRQLQLRMAEAILAEDAVADLAPDDDVVAVFPFTYEGSDPRYGPLGRAVAAMMITDLSQTDRLTVVERLQVNALMDEVALGQTGLVDPSTAARSGMRIGAGNVVQGVLGGDAESVSLRTGVARIEGDGVSTSEVTSAEAELQRLIDLEKEAALALYASMGVQLTAAEEERVRNRYTDNIQALLAFGEGLEAEDRGDFGTAAARFQEAVRLDPSFTLAGERVEPMTRLEEGRRRTTGDVAQDAGDLLVGVAVDEYFDLDRAVQGAQDLVPTPEVRDPVVEVLGEEGFRPRATLNIRVKRPGGGP